MSTIKRKGHTHCCVNKCSNTLTNSPGVSFYRFPKATFHTYKQKRRNDWIFAVQKAMADGSAWQPTDNTRICSQHFVGNVKHNDPLSPSYNPSIFPTVNRKSTISENTAVERYKRAKRRRLERSMQQTICSYSTNVTLVPADKDVLHKGIQLNDCDNNQHAKNEDPPRKINQGTQVCFFDEINSSSDPHSNTFICNRYIYMDSKTGSTTCDAETQSCIPELAKSPKIVFQRPKSVSRSCGTDIVIEDKAVGLKANECDSDGLLKCTFGFHGISSIQEDQDMLDLAGVTPDVFQLLLKMLPPPEDCKISKPNRLLIFLIKMKCALTYLALGVLFGVDQRTISRIFGSVLQCLAVKTKNFVFWPSKEIIQATMPQIFKETYSDCRVIIDCTELRVEQPPNIDSRVRFYSHYKHSSTVKILVGCTPSGAISFVSKCYGGKTTDAQITTTSGFLELLEPDDVVLADKEFPQIKTKLDEAGRVLLVIPPFLRNNTFSDEEVEETYKVTKVRIHIERVMERLRTYRILDKLTINLLPLSDDIVFVCCVLVNLQPSIIKEE